MTRSPNSSQRLLADSEHQVPCEDFASVKSLFCLGKVENIFIGKAKSCEIHRIQIFFFYFSFVSEQIVSWEQIYFFFLGVGFVVPCHHRAVLGTQPSLLFTSHVILGMDCTGMKKTADRLEIEGSVELSDILSLST